MSLSPPDIGRGWTLADLGDLPDDAQRYELVDGGLVVTPAPSQHHQDLGNDICELLRSAAPPGWRVRTEYLLPFAQDTQRIPDVVVFRWPLQQPRDDTHSPLGPPDVGLIVEVVSPSTRRTDRFAKPGEYADAGIGLFWRLETEPELVLHTFALHGSSYEPVTQIRGSGSARVPWGELAIDLTMLGS